ncbi:DnaB-like helicase C-terminal domain-containing protein [Magnetospirillum sp. XM-1]|uniref:DnaB-like helicase C-terminal domain-containing protein n=1 Tax=Magnetospirillum sp. XM-1 TaxID=1663591 RepID=UPI000837AD42|nr:DnaB-like helicase C-terminal domain-containing protein [Magnetospirillum sp. XM-1]
MDNHAELPSLRTKHEVARAAIEARLAAGATFSTGIYALDALIDGIRPRTFTVIDAASAETRTILCGTLADNLNIQGAKVLFVTFVHSPEEIELRMACRRMNLRMEWLRNSSGRDISSLAAKAEAYLSAIPDNTVYLPTICPTVDEILLGINHAMNAHGVQVVVLDIGGFEMDRKDELFWLDLGRGLRRFASTGSLSVIAAVSSNEEATSCLQISATELLRMTSEDDGYSLGVILEKSIDVFGSVARLAKQAVYVDAAGPHMRDADAGSISVCGQASFTRHFQE